jgi:hypothetical protein
LVVEGSRAKVYKENECRAGTDVEALRVPIASIPAEACLICCSLVVVATIPNPRDLSSAVGIFKCSEVILRIRINITEVLIEFVSLMPRATLKAFKSFCCLLLTMPRLLLERYRAD